MTSPVLDKHRPSETARQVVLTTAGIVAANLTVFFALLARRLDQFDDRAAGEIGGGLAGEMWFPLFALGLTQTAITGLVLACWKATRPIGLGLFTAAAVGVGAIAVLGFFLVLVIGS